MHLADLINRASPPIPWMEGDNIPWNEPGFSRRMLNEHLSQAHDAASRCFNTIDRHVDWIHSRLLSQKPTSILDLCCGPGLYASRLAHLGHSCHGIDYSPASIEYAITTTTREQLSCTYDYQDIRKAEYPQGVELVMLIYGEFNVFRPADAVMILDKSWQALTPGGLLLLEPHPWAVVKRLGDEPPSWYSSPGGLFSDAPHVVFQENFWDEVTETTTNRYFVLDVGSDVITPYAQSMQAYFDDDYRELLASHGFSDIQILPGLLGGDSAQELMAILASKGI